MTDRRHCQTFWEGRVNGRKEYSVGNSGISSDDGDVICRIGMPADRRCKGMRLVVCLKWPITRGKHIMRSPLCYMSARNPSNTDPCLTPSTSTIPYLHFTGMSVPCSLTARPWSNDAFQQLQRHAQQSVTIASVVMTRSWT